MRHQAERILQRIGKLEEAISPALTQGDTSRVIRISSGIYRAAYRLERCLINQMTQTEDQKTLKRLKRAIDAARAWKEDYLPLSPHYEKLLEDSREIYQEGYPRVLNP